MKIRLPLLKLVVLALAGAALLPTSPASAAARQVYVAPSGSDSAAGTLTSPWKTIAKSLPKLRAGDVLFARGGTYAERIGGKGMPFLSVADGTPTAPITVKAYPGERPVLEGLLWVHDPDNWVFDGLNVRWSTLNSPEEHMVRIRNGTNWAYRNAEISGARSYANFNVLSSVAGEPSNWSITGNCIHDNLGDPSHGTAKDQLMYINTGTTAGPGLIERNLLFNAPRGKGIKLAGPDPGTGSANVTVRYNTIHNTYKPAVVVGWATRDSTVYRNILTRTQDVSLVRGYQLTGTGNAAYDNLGSSAPAVVSSDHGYQTVADGGNLFPLNPLYNQTTSCSGFLPLNATALAYGHSAL